MLNQNAFKIASQTLQKFSEDNLPSFDLYKLALNEACQLNYNSTILCPILSGSVKDWAHFQVSLVNEIVYFTQIIQMPACLISGGYLDNSENRHFEFAKYFFENLFDTKHQVNLVSLSINQSNFVVFGKNNIQQTIQNSSLHQAKLDLRFILIDD